MRSKGFGLIALLGALLGGAPVAEAGCPCPKAKMIELYGSVSMFPSKLPGPRLHQPTIAKPAEAQAVTGTSIPSMAEVARSLSTPVLARMDDPTLDDPLAWQMLFVEQ